MGRIALVSASLAAFVALTGCGQSGDEAAVRATTKTFFNAYRSGDGARACQQLSTATAQAVAQQQQSSCAKGVTDLQLRPGAVRRVEVVVTSAKVDLAGGASAFLSEEADGWRLSAVGCRPQADPLEQPMDCEAEA
jgi:hypothetical protein